MHAGGRAPAVGAPAVQGAVRRTMMMTWQGRFSPAPAMPMQTTRCSTPPTTSWCRRPLPALCTTTSASEPGTARPAVGMGGSGLLPQQPALRPPAAAPATVPACLLWDAPLLPLACHSTASRPAPPLLSNQVWRRAGDAGGHGGRRPEGRQPPAAAHADANRAGASAGHLLLPNLRQKGALVRLRLCMPSSPVYAVVMWMPSSPVDARPWWSRAGCKCCAAACFALHLLRLTMPLQLPRPGPRRCAPPRAWRGSAATCTPPASGAASRSSSRRRAQRWRAAASCCTRTAQVGAGAGAARHSAGLGTLRAPQLRQPGAGGEWTPAPQAAPPSQSPASPPHHVCPGMSATMFSLVGRATETPRFALGRLQATVRAWPGCRGAE